MANPDIGAIVAQVWSGIDKKPYDTAIIEMKTGKRYFVASKYFGKTFEIIAEYRTRYQTGHFDLECVHLIQGVKVPFYRQRKGRSEPRFDYPPTDYPNNPVLITDDAYDTLPVWKNPSMFESSALLEKLR